MIYKHRRSGHLYQVVLLGARMPLLNQLVLDPAAFSDMAPVVIARADWQNCFVYPKGVYDEKQHCPKVAEGTLQLAQGQQLRRGDLVVVYRGEDGAWWVRPEKEFFDGRFVPLSGSI